MDGQGVKHIADLAAAAAIPKPYVIEGAGFKKLAHATSDSEGIFEWQFLDLPHDTPGLDPVILHTLSGLADYISANRDERALAECTVFVKSHAEVLFVSKAYGELPRRDLYAVAKFDDLIRASVPGIANHTAAFAFGQWHDPETFNVALQTLFDEGEDRDKLLSVVGNVRSEGVTTVEDDGTTQSVTMSAGVRVGKLVNVPNPVTLAPWRTFRELEQPQSKFVLRVKGEPGEQPRIALFEADGGYWRVDAIESIAAYLRPLVPSEVVVVA